jgi:hypothetical protein
MTEIKKLSGCKQIRIRIFGEFKIHYEVFTNFAITFYLDWETFDAKWAQLDLDGINQQKYIVKININLTCGDLNCRFWMEFSKKVNQKLKIFRK